MSLNKELNIIVKGRAFVGGGRTQTSIGKVRNHPSAPIRSFLHSSIRKIDFYSFSQKLWKVLKMLQLNYKAMQQAFSGKVCIYAVCLKKSMTERLSPAAIWQKLLAAFPMAQHSFSSFPCSVALQPALGYAALAWGCAPQS